MLTGLECEGDGKSFPLVLRNIIFHEKLHLPFTLLGLVYHMDVANRAALSSVGYNPSSVLVKIFGHFILVFIVYFMSDFNSHQLRAVPAAVITCCQNCRCISTRWSYVLFIISEIHHECLTNLIYSHCMVALHS